VSKRPRGPLPGWKPSTDLQRGVFADLVARYEQHERERTFPRGGRGIFYDLRPAGMGNGVTYRKPDSQHPVSEVVNGKRVRLFGPMEAHPDYVQQEVLALSRRAGLIAEHLVADTRAPEPDVPLADDDAAGFARMVARRRGGGRETSDDQVVFWLRLNRRRGGHRRTGEEQRAPSALLRDQLPSVAQ
jgi:hypothetical protein